MADTPSYEFKITETRVFDVDLDRVAVTDDMATGSDWDQHAEALSAMSAEGWELVSTELAYVSGKTITRGSAKTGQMIETHHPERRSLALWRRPAQS